MVMIITEEDHVWNSKQLTKEQSNTILQEVRKTYFK